MKQKVFLSHSSEDKTKVREVNEYLIANGIDTWFDEAELLPGDHLIDKLDEAISKKCNILLAFISYNSMGSPWVTTELRWALERSKVQNNIKIIPVMIDEITIPAYLEIIFWVNLFDQNKKEHELNQLLNSIIAGEKISTYISDKSYMPLPGDKIDEKHVKKFKYFFYTYIGVLSFFFIVCLYLLKPLYDSNLSIDSKQFLAIALFSGAMISTSLIYTLLIYIAQIMDGNIRLISGLKYDILPNIWLPKYKKLINENIPQKYLKWFKFHYWLAIVSSFIFIISFFIGIVQIRNSKINTDYDKLQIYYDKLLYLKKETK